MEQRRPPPVTGGGGTFTVTGNHIYAEGNTWMLKVTVHDEGDSSNTEATGTATVPDAPLTATGPSGLTVAEGGAVATTLAHFTDADTGPVPPPSHFTATVSWGDGSSTPASITGLGGGEGYDVTASPHVFAEEGSYDLMVSITDVGGAQATVTIPVNVLDLPLAATPVSALSVSGLGSASFSGRLASFTDADPGNQVGDYTAQILWGDGAVSQGTVAAASPGVYAVTGAHAYAQSGTYSVTALVRDGGGQSVVAQTSLTATVEHIIVCVAAATTGVRFPCGPAAVALPSSEPQGQEPFSGHSSAHSRPLQAGQSHQAAPAQARTRQARKARRSPRRGQPIAGSRSPGAIGHSGLGATGAGSQAQDQAPQVSLSTRQPVEWADRVPSRSVRRIDV